MKTFLTPGIFQNINFNPTNHSRGSIAMIVSYWVIIRHECSGNVAFWGRKYFPTTISPPGWKILITWLWSDDHSYCNFLRRIQFWSSLAHRKTPWGVKSAFLGRKPHFQGWKKSVFCDFSPRGHPGLPIWPRNLIGHQKLHKKSVSVHFFIIDNFCQITKTASELKGWDPI